VLHLNGKPTSYNEDEWQNLLRTAKIGLNEPGCILSDIQLLLGFIGKGNIRTGSKRGNLPPSVLPILNQLLAYPIKIDLTQVPQL
jgi:hypothetical protein